MANNPYKDGQKSFRNGYSQNPYMSTIARDEWQRGYDDAESEAANKQDAYTSRRDGLWEVPERARDEYMQMEDNFSPSTVLRFMLAMHPEDV
jgi:hypothetical protein